MIGLRSMRVTLVAGVSLAALSLWGGPAYAQDVTPAPSTTSVASPAVSPSIPANGKRVYTPADFARFSPKTAYDMLVQVPSFTIKQGDSSERGLGQASENVLINGERINNKNYGGGDAGAVDELHRVPAADVERIEIVDAAALGIAGLSGQVANVVTRKNKKASGQFEWRPSFRAHYAKPDLLRGSISYSGTSGPVDYTFSIKNQTGRGAFGGPIIISDASDVVTERRHEIYHEEDSLLTFQSKFKLDGPGSSVGNLTLGYTPYWINLHQYDTREFVSGDHGARDTTQTLSGAYYDINADYEFTLGPGRLKLIGLDHHDHEPFITTQVTHFDSRPFDNGVRFGRNSLIDERIGRGEYHWKSGKNDWQLSFERAFNSLNQRGSLSILNEDGVFEPQDFPEGSGHVTEVRYEGIATLSRPLSSKLDLQVAAGAEQSTLDRVDDELPARKFFRPKGSLTLGWRPSEGWDASLKIRRRVGQISFYDFLAQPKLVQDRENAGNPDLVPPQSWEFETEVGRELGKWGKTRLRGWYYKVDDIVDVIPLADHTEGVGNLPHATRIGLESTSTINFDPIGWTGAKLDAQIGFEKTSVRDPLTGKKRQISGIQNRWVNLSLRHDIPHTKLAWGAEASYGHITKNYFLTEVFQGWEGPNFVDLYVEDKDVFGLTVRATVGNILNARHRSIRYHYADWRDNSPVDFIERHNQLIGPIFSLSVKGTF